MKLAGNRRVFFSPFELLFSNWRPLQHLATCTIRAWKRNRNKSSCRQLFTHAQDLSSQQFNLSFNKGRWGRAVSHYTSPFCPNVSELVRAGAGPLAWVIVHKDVHILSPRCLLEGKLLPQSGLISVKLVLRHSSLKAQMWRRCCQQSLRNKCHVETLKINIFKS